MDIRIEKTERAIKNAFLELRSRKPLGKITIKELCSLAAINKSTFYSHYEDIYALSDKMESETIVSVLKKYFQPAGGAVQESGCIYKKPLHGADLKQHPDQSLVFRNRKSPPR